MARINRDRFRVLKTNSLAGGANENEFVLGAIPNGQKWQVDRLICSDQNTGDNKSSEFVIRFGSQILFHGFLTGTTHMLNNAKIILNGDGSQRLRVQRRNHSTDSKTIVVIIEGFKRVK